VLAERLAQEEDVLDLLNRTPPLFDFDYQKKALKI
jgi:hypothetical protein